MTRTLRVAVVASLAVALGLSARAQAPNLATYQGRLQENGVPVSGQQRAVEVRLCDRLSGGNCYPNPPTATVPPGGCSGTVQCVDVVNGVFKVVFPIPSGANLSTITWYLEIAVGLTAPGSALNPLQPREGLTSVPYAQSAFKAASLTGTLDPSQISAGKLDTAVIATTFDTAKIATLFLQDKAVTTAKLADASVDSTKLAADAVNAAAILNGSVDSTKLAPGAVTALGVTAGSLDTTKLAADAVATAAILGGAVNSAKLAADAVTNVAILGGTIQTAKLAADAVAAIKLLNGAVQTSKLGADAVTGASILNATVQTAKLAKDAVTTASILNGAVDASKFAAGAVDTAKLAGDAVAFAAILNAAVGTSKLAADAVNSSKILSGAITADKFAAGALLSSGVGLNRLGAMTRTGFSRLGSDYYQLQVGLARTHAEIFFFTPGLNGNPTDIQFKFFHGGIDYGSSNGFIVKRTIDGTISNDTGFSAVGLIGNGSASASFSAGTRIQARLTLDGNTGSPTYIIGTFEAMAFTPSGSLINVFRGSFSVPTGTGSPPATDVMVTTVAGTNLFPADTYLVVYGEDFP